MPVSSYLKLSLFFALTTSLAGWLLLGEAAIPETADGPYSGFAFKESLAHRRVPGPLPTFHYTDEELAHVVEQMPLFPGCEDLGSYAEKKACADKKLLEFIYGNIKYPPSAVERGVAGTAVISFVVEKDGSVGEPKIVRNPGAGTGEEALRVVKLMAEQTSPWVPGTTGPEKKPVEVQFNLPVKFKLE